MRLEREPEAESAALQAFVGFILALLAWWCITEWGHFRDDGISRFPSGLLFGTEAAATALVLVWTAVKRAPTSTVIFAAIITTVLVITLSLLFLFPT